MATTYGLTATGFVRKTLEVMTIETSARIAGLVGVVPVGALQKLMMAFLERVAEVWELLEAIVAGGDPNEATGTLQDAINSITGTVRNPATPSTATLTLTGTPGTFVPKDTTRSKVPVLLTTYTHKADGTINAVVAWAASTNYVAGDRRRNGGTQRVYQCTIAGMSAASGGPTTTASAIADGGVTWRYVGDGTGAVDVTATCTVKGPVTALNGTITTIDTPVVGWNGVNNLTDATPGTNVETDEDYRVRREQELAQAGSGTSDAIRAALLEITGVTSATVFSNDTDITDVDGMPPHSVEALVRGGADADIGVCLLNEVADGIATRGGVTTTPIDSEGTLQVVKFSRPTEKNIGVAITVTYDQAVGVFPSDGVAQIKAAIVAFGRLQKSGKNAVSFSIGAQALKVAGVFDVTVCNIIAVNAPSVPGVPVASTTIAIALRELAVFDTAWIAVTANQGTP